MSVWPEILVILALVGSALMAGTFFIFSTTVMKALAERPAAEGIQTMQAINRVIINPLFIGSFMGTAQLCLATGVLALFGMGPFDSHWFLSAACFYLFGTFFYTVVRNVPLNDELEEVSAEQAPEYWQFYLQHWTRRNHHRTVSSILAVTFYAIGLLQM